MHLIDGKTLAEKIRVDLKRKITEGRLHPRLAILLVGEDPASHLYVSLKKKAAEEVGIRVDSRHLPAATPDQELAALVETWNRDPDVTAILVQIPLPPGHDEHRIVAAIDPTKDVDGFHPATTVTAPVHEGILRLINETPLELNGATAALIVNSPVFAAPLERLLIKAGMTVTVMSPDERDFDRLKQADLIVIAVGRAKFLNAAMTRPDAVIIDVGTNKTPEGKTRGDAGLESFRGTDVWITPVPGGVGPMTIAHLLKNVVRLAQTGSQVHPLDE